MIVDDGVSTFVELFHGIFAGPFSFCGVCRALTVVMSLADRSLAWRLGEDSGVRLCVCLCPGRSGVTGVVGWLGRSALNRDLRLLIGSEDGTRVLLMFSGVTGVLGERCEPVIFFANLRSGEMDRDMGALLRLGGVPRYPFRDAPDALGPPSLSVPSPVSILRTASISESVLWMRSRKFFHRCADSACRRNVSPFFVTRSRTPLSMIDRTLDVAGM